MMVSAALTLHADPWRNDDPIDTVISYNPRDPFAVRLMPWCPAFERPVTWEFALELLLPGCRQESGADVHVAWGEMAVAITLSPPSGTLTLHADACTLAAFLDEVHRSAPGPNELDALLDQAVKDLHHRALSQR